MVTKDGNMIEYLVSLILGLIFGILIERSKKENRRERELVSKGMTLSLFFLIFFLGLDIGRKLNLQEMAQIGQISILFALMTMVFSYAFSKILIRVAR
ncbi:hypothetical protein DRP07_02650 [Archaeoglobales archaeon]|nr:MAG: hypothetical protein DRP07_02650 [Archaeoglobales archaeon]